MYIKLKTILEGSLGYKRAMRLSKSAGKAHDKVMDEPLLSKDFDKIANKSQERRNRFRRVNTASILKNKFRGKFGYK